MVSNCTCRSPARTSGGSASPACRYFSNAPSTSPSACGGGGTYAALPGRLPPIQFWLRRTSPGSFSAPRTPRIRRECVSFSRRIESGRPFGIRELRARVGERVEVVAHLLDVGVGRGALLGAVLGLEREQVDEGRLRALDLRREHGLLADERVDEPVERGDHLPSQLEANEGLLSRTEALGQGGVDDDGRIRGRQRVRDEGRDLLPTHGGPLVSSGGSFGMSAPLGTPA
jgi:hypothetical protein